MARRAAGRRASRTGRTQPSGAPRALDALLACSLLVCACASSRALPSPRALPEPPSSRLAPCVSRGDAALDVAFSRVPDERALRASICDWFDGHRWRVRFLPLEQLWHAPDVRRTPLDVRLAVIASPSGGVELHFEAPTQASPSARRRWMAPLALQSGLDDAGVEVVAQTLHSTAQAIEEVALEWSAAPAREPSPDSARSSAASSRAASPPAPRRAAAPSHPSTSGAPSIAEPSSPEARDSAVRGGTDDGATSSPQPRPRHLSVHTGLGYHLVWRGPEPVTHGPNLRIELDWSQAPQVTLASFIDIAGFVSGSAQADSIALSLSGATLDAGLSASTPLGALGPGFLGRFGVLSGVDLLDLDVRTSQPETVRLATDQSPRPRWFVGLELGLEHRWGDFEVGLLARLRWQLLASHYEVLAEGSELTILRPWRLQLGPALLLAYAW